LAFEPHQRPPHRALQEGDVLREQQGAERHHPQPENGQNAEDPADDQEDPRGNADPAGRRIPQPALKTRSRLWELLFEAIEPAVEPLIVPVGHGPPPR
jgi:hypothetical protein